MKIVKNLKKTFWKTLIIDIVLLLLLFTVGVYAKSYLVTFFDQVEDYQSALLALDDELVNQSATAILEAEGIANDFSFLVYFTYIFVLVIVPFLFYSITTILQSVNIGIVTKKLSKKYVFKMFVLGLPFFLAFLLIEGIVTTSLVSFLESKFNLLLAFIVLMVIFLKAYLWFTGAILLAKGKKLIDAKIVYNKFYKLFSVFALIGFLVVIVLSLVFFLLARYLSDSAALGEAVMLVLFALFFLTILQVLRVWYVNLVVKA